MGISDRKKKILAALVDEYIKTAEPVGSKAIAKLANLGCQNTDPRRVQNVCKRADGKAEAFP